MEADWTAAPTCSYCGWLGWTVEKYGRVTHKQACPHRTDPWHQGDQTAAQTQPEYLTPWRHVIDLLEAAGLRAYPPRNSALAKVLAYRDRRDRHLDLGRERVSTRTLKASRPQCGIACVSHRGVVT